MYRVGSNPTAPTKNMLIDFYPKDIQITEEGVAFRNALGKQLGGCSECGKEHYNVVEKMNKLFRVICLDCFNKDEKV